MDDYNAEAFQTARRATVMPTFQEALAVLSQINEEQIGDEDVAKYVEFCKDLTRYCIEHGIQRNTDLNPWSVLIRADKEKAARTALRRWWHRGVAGPLRSVVEGVWLAIRLRGWFKLQEQLLAKYP